jgi:glycosyltransferase involved in cell wall biosynthesis
LKVLIITSNIVPTGGTERAISNLANMLADKDVDVSIISVSSLTTQSAYYPISSKVEITHLEQPAIPIGVKNKLAWYLKTIKLLRKEIKRRNAKVIIGAGHNINSLLPFCKGNSQSKIIGCEHIVLKTIPLFSRLLMKTTYRFLDQVVVLSEQARTQMLCYTSHVSVIPNTLPFFPEQAAFLSSKRIIMVGRLSAEKGYDRVASIAEKLKLDYPDWHIDIFGNGGMHDELVALYKNNALDNFITIHPISTNIEQEYLQSSICMMTSYSEAMPMVLLEAKACGLPIIAYNCEGTQRLINDGSDGYVIDNDSLEDFIMKVESLISNRTLRFKMGSKGRENCKQFLPDNIAKLWINLFETIKD